VVFLGIHVWTTKQLNNASNWHRKWRIQG
jgi:hypothetical protein